MRKPFDQKLFDEHDQSTKDAISRYFKSNYKVDVWFAQDYEIDMLIMTKTNDIFLIEMEKRINWVDEFPFSTVHVPYRKKKHFQDPRYRTFMFSVRGDCEKALWCEAESIINSPVVEQTNKYLSNEPFFDVALSKWTLVDLC